MKLIFFTLATLVLSLPGWAAQKAKIVSPSVDIYSESDFDSEVLDTVRQGEDFFISDKPVGPFFKIKLKSGKIGYIPDTEVFVEGKGRVVPGAAEVSDDPFLQQMDESPRENKKTPTKNKNKKKPEPEEEDEDDEDTDLRGVTLQLVNFHEDTLGGVQVDDLPAIGYKSLSDLSWEVLASFKTPKYYDKLNATAKVYHLWADFGISNPFPISKLFTFRYGGGLLGHISYASIQSAAKTYDMQEVTAGVFLEGAIQLRTKKLKYDFSAKYIFDRQSYGALGFTIFF